MNRITISHSNVKNHFYIEPLSGRIAVNAFDCSISMRKDIYG